MKKSRQIYNRNYKFKKRYGINLFEYNNLLASQDFKCAICGINHMKDGKKLHVDHDHGTNKVRGLLCGGCNRAIGILLDSTELLFKAIHYLNRNK